MSSSAGCTGALGVGLDPAWSPLAAQVSGSSRPVPGLGGWWGATDPGPPPVSWWRRLVGAAAGTTTRTSGRPPSANGASSLHLAWRWPGSPPPLTSVAVTLTVLEPPQVDALYFWALQASFVEGPGAGRRHGGGHVGLQHHPRVPGHRAVNWGGYGADGVELRGTESALPSSLGNPNTRDLAWEVGRPHRLAVHRSEVGWAATVDGVLVRELHAGGDRLAEVVVWSEVFARCDDPPVAVRWSDPAATTAGGGEVRPEAVVTRYQSVPAGGCSNTSSDADGRGGVVQRTATARTTPPGAVIPLR